MVVVPPDGIEPSGPSLPCNSAADVCSSPVFLALEGSTPLQLCRCAGAATGTINVEVIGQAVVSATSRNGLAATAPALMTPPMLYVTCPSAEARSARPLLICAASPGYSGAYEMCTTD